MMTVDMSCDISEVSALADTLVLLDQDNSELYNRAAPYLIRILQEKAAALVQKHDDLEKEIRALRRRAA